jgi:hypothetical protein
MYDHVPRMQGPKGVNDSVRWVTIYSFIICRVNRAGKEKGPGGPLPYSNLIAASILLVNSVSAL